MDDWGVISGGLLLISFFDVFSITFSARDGVSLLFSNSNVLVSLIWCKLFLFVDDTDVVEVLFSLASRGSGSSVDETSVLAAESSFVVSWDGDDWLFSCEGLISIVKKKLKFSLKLTIWRHTLLYFSYYICTY